MVAAYADAHDNVGFIDVAACLIGEDGTPDPGLFLADGLHLNDRGYELWAAVVRPRVLEAWRAP